MHAVLSLGLGYLMGCMNPAALVGKKKNVDLKNTGTGNLGATNTALVLGQKAGWFVLIFDMLAGRLEVFPMLMLLYPPLWKEAYKEHKRKQRRREAIRQQKP